LLEGLLGSELKEEEEEEEGRKDGVTYRSRRYVLSFSV
jgi:hypothetical protein